MNTKACLICGSNEPAEAPSCAQCGEGSFAVVVAVQPEPQREPVAEQPRQQPQRGRR